jgi:Phospholipase_D-nuclease N-terminal
MASSAVALPSILQMVLGLYGYLLPLLLYALWSTLALWDLGRRPALRSGTVWLWAAAVFLLPFVGPIIYLLFGGGEMSRQSRLVTLGGGAAVYVLVLLVGALTGGIT